MDSAESVAVKFPSTLTFAELHVDDNNVLATAHFQSDLRAGAFVLDQAAKVVAVADSFAIKSTDNVVDAQTCLGGRRFGGNPGNKAIGPAIIQRHAQEGVGV